MEKILFFKSLQSRFKFFVTCDMSKIIPANEQCLQIAEFYYINSNGRKFCFLKSVQRRFKIFATCDMSKIIPAKKQSLQIAEFYYENSCRVRNAVLLKSYLQERSLFFAQFRVLSSQWQMSMASLDCTSWRVTKIPT